MNIHLYFKKGEYIDISIGYKTDYHASMYWLNITKVYEENGEVVFAESLLTCFKNFKYWFK